MHLRTLLRKVCTFHQAAPSYTQAQAHMNTHTRMYTHTPMFRTPSKRGVPTNPQEKTSQMPRNMEIAVKRPHLHIT